MKIWCLLIAALSLVLASCAESQPKAGGQDQVSAIPWNRPEKWEGQGMMGGMGTR